MSAANRLLVATLLTLGACKDAAMPGEDLGGSLDLLDPCVADPASCSICNKDGDCRGDRPRCDVTTSTCVKCLPASDNCPTGTVCQNVSGGWDCRTICLSDTDCAKLGGGLLCCSGVCVDPGADVMNCGSCGRVCDQVPNGQPGCFAGGCIIKTCNSGFEDCDKQLVGGCEINVNTNPENCGKCGTVCMPAPNGAPSCAAGKCSSACRTGFADCDGNATNGCEIDTLGLVQHCGGCGRACVAPKNARTACDEGTCSFRCELGFGDCDRMGGNGCEASLGQDTQACGHCGNICPFRPNALEPKCDKGVCGSTCLQAFGDCDSNPNNGCESPLETSFDHCGACGALCSKANTTSATCSGGVCTLVCKVGYVDCNLDTKDGCEAQLTSDPNNCSACGVVCPPQTPACSEGKCTNKLRVVAGFVGEVGPDYTRDDWVQCVGVLDKANVDDLPNQGWGNKCMDMAYTKLRLVCGASAQQVHYIDISRNVFVTKLNAYPEQGLISGASFVLGGNDIYASGNDPNNGTSWWVNGNGCNEASQSITINNGCTWDASNCFGQNINGDRYFYAYIKK